MDDDQIHNPIERLLSEDHELWQREAGGGASADEQRRLDSLNVTLDHCSDLPVVEG